MGETATRLDRQFPAYPTGWSGDKDALILAATLLIGLVGFVPAFALSVQGLAIGLPLPSLLGVGIVLVAYAAIVALIRRPVVGTLSALVVFSTFAANVPLSSSAGRMPGTPGVNLWLFEIPLLIGLGIATIQRWHHDVTLTRTHALFAGFVGWAFLAALFGAGPRPVAAVTFAFHFLTALAAFTFVAAAIERNVLELRTVVALVSVATLAHALFALVQLFHGGSFGLTRLGETDRFSPVYITVGSVRLTGGIHLSGFTGGTNALAALVLLVAPVALTYVLLASTRTRSRAIVATAALGLFALITLIAKDASRGAALVAVGVALVASLAVVIHRVRFWSGSAVSILRLTGVKRRLIAGGFIIVASFTILLQPSSQSGWAARVPTGNDTGSTNGASGGGRNDTTAVTNATSTPSGGDASAPTPPDISALEGIDVPLFGLQTLGVRARQYLSAIDIATRYPLFGLGGANFPYLAVEQYGLQPAARFSSRLVSNAIHNAYFAVLVGTGVPGLVLFCATLVAVAWTCVGLIRGCIIETWLVLGLMCAIIAYAAYIFWTVAFVTVAGSIPFWMIAGGIVGARVRVGT